MAECYGEEGAFEPRIRSAHLAHPLRGQHGGVAQPSVASLGEWATGISVSALANGGGQSRVTSQMSGAGEPADVADLGYQGETEEGADPRDAPEPLGCRMSRRRLIYLALEALGLGMDERQDLPQCGQHLSRVTLQLHLIQPVLSLIAQEHQHLVCEALGIKRMRTPDGVTLHRLFVRLDVEAFEAVLGKWLSDRGLKRGQGIAVDGKTLRGIHGEELPGVHLVAAYAHHSGVVWGQRSAPGKGRELEAVRAVLESLDLKGQIVTGDALLAQRDICRTIKKKGASGSSG